VVVRTAARILATREGLEGEAVGRAASFNSLGQQQSGGKEEDDIPKGNRATNQPQQDQGSTAAAALQTA